MKTENHSYKDLNEIKNKSQLDFRYVFGSIRLILRKLLLKSDSDLIVNEFINYKFKIPHIK